MHIDDQNPTVTVMDVVVSAGSQEVTLASTLNFTDKVEKILDIIANICNIGYHIVGNKIIVQGMLHKQIFYINNHGKTKFQTEQLPFATFIDMDGVQQHHHIRLEGRVDQMQRQLCLHGSQLKQRTTLIFEGTALETRRYVIYCNQGYRYRIREIVARKECRVHEDKQTVCSIPTQQARLLDIQCNNMQVCIHVNKVVVRGAITRRLEYVTDSQSRYMEEEFPVEYWFDVPGVKADMHAVIQAENDGKVLKYAAPVLNKEGTIINQELELCFCILVCRHKQLSVLHGEGPIMLLQRPLGEGTFLRTLEHDIELPPNIASLVNAEGRLFDVEQEMILDKMLIRGWVEYKIQYLEVEAQEQVATFIKPFIVALDFAGVDAKNLGEVKIISLPIEIDALEQNKIKLHYKLQLIGQVFEEILMPVAAEQIQSI